jgi:hypothetical protein
MEMAQPELEPFFQRFRFNNSQLQQAVTENSYCLRLHLKSSLKILPLKRWGLERTMDVQAR